MRKVVLSFSLLVLSCGNSGGPVHSDASVDVGVGDVAIGTGGEAGTGTGGAGSGGAAGAADGAVLAADGAVLASDGAVLASDGALPGQDGPAAGGDGAIVDAAIDASSGEAATGTGGTGDAPTASDAGDGGAAVDAGTVGADGAIHSPCSDPAFPVSCPALGDVPALCWSASTRCETITKCGDQYRSCTVAGAHYDCTVAACVNSTADGGSSVCGAPYPVACPALGDVPALCWTAGTVCSTVQRCGNDFKSCLMAGYHYACDTQTCAPDQGADGSVDGR